MKQNKDKFRLTIILAAILAVLAVLYLLPPALLGFPAQGTWNPKNLHVSESGGMYVSNAGDLFAWGPDRFGRLSGKFDALYINRRLMTDVQEAEQALWCVLALKENGELWACSGDESVATILDQQPEERNFLVMEDVVSIACNGITRYSAVQEDGTLWTWGDWDNGQGGTRKPWVVMENAASVISNGQLFGVVDRQNRAYIFGEYYDPAWDDMRVLDQPIQVASDIAEISALEPEGFQLLTTDGQVLRYHMLRDRDKAQEELEVLQQDVAHLCGSGFLKTDGSLWDWKVSGQNLHLRHVAEQVVNANCNEHVVSYVDADGKMVAQNKAGETLKQYSVYDFAMNRWPLLRLWPWKWTEF